MSSISVSLKTLGKKYAGVIKAFEPVLWICLLLVLVARVFRTLLFPFYYPFMDDIAGVCLFVIAALGALRLLLKGSIKKEDIFLVAVVAILCILFFVTKEDIFLQIAFLSLGFAGMSYRNVLKGYVIIVLFFVGSVAIASMTGVIPNMVNFYDPVTFKDSFGIADSADFTSYLFFLAVFFWMAWDKLPHYVTLFLDILVFLVARFTDSNACMLFATIMFAVVLTVTLTELLIKKGIELKKLKKIFDTLLLITFPILIFIFGDMFSKYGVVIGILFSLAACSLWINVMRKAAKADNYRFALGMILIAGFSLLENHYTELNYNILLFVPFINPGLEGSEKEVKFAGKKVLISFVLSVLYAGIFAIFAKYIFTALRTAFNWLSSLGELGVSLLFINFVLLFICGSVLLIVGLSQIFYKIFGCEKSSEVDKNIVVLEKNKPVKGLVALALGACLLVMVSVFLMLTIERTKNDKVVRAEIQADKPALDIIFSEASGKVYSAKYPLAYMSDYEQFSYSVLDGENLARSDNATVLVNRTDEMNLFFTSGYVYTPISAYSAVYTNDSLVMDKLSSSGYRQYGYFNEIRFSVDTTSSPMVDLKACEYEINAEMFITDIYDYEKLNVYGDDTNGAAETVAYIEASVNNGDKILDSLPITDDMLSYNGYVNFVGKFKLADDTRKVTFSIKPAVVCDISVSEFSLRPRPEYDVHIGVDGNRRKVWEKYFSSDGKLVNNNFGYAICSYGYDENGRISECNYFDNEGKAILTTFGYSGKKLTYNDDGLVVREDYFGISGEPLLMD